MINLSEKEKEFVNYMSHGEEETNYGFELLSSRAVKPAVFFAIRDAGLFLPEKILKLFLKKTRAIIFPIGVRWIIYWPLQNMPLKIETCC